MGVARNIVLRAAHEGLLAGADLICLDADVDDWPIRLYQRFGFDEISRAWVFTKRPDHSSAVVAGLVKHSRTHSPSGCADQVPYA